MTSLNISKSITSISDYVFHGCSNLASVIIPNGVTSIGENAFNGCTSLSDVTIPNSVVRIKYRAFYNCTSLTSITIPESVTNISSSAFEDCMGLTDVNCMAEIVPTTSTDAFYNSPIASAMLHVPAASLEDYKETVPWSRFGTIVPLPEGILAIATATTVSPAETATPGSATTDEGICVSLDDEDEVDAEEGSVTMHTTMTAEEVQALAESMTPETQGFSSTFKGIYFLIAAGKGTIELDVETFGNCMMSVMRGSTLIGNYVQATKGTIVIDYDIEEDTWFFVYSSAGSPSGIRRAVAADTDGGLKVYSVRIIPVEIYDPDGISLTPALSKEEGEWYDLSGRRIAKPQKGINIKDGKKIMKK